MALKHLELHVKQTFDMDIQKRDNQNAPCLVGLQTPIIKVWQYVKIAFNQTNGIKPDKMNCIVLYMFIMLQISKMTMTIII